MEQDRRMNSELNRRGSSNRSQGPQRQDEIRITDFIYAFFKHFRLIIVCAVLGLIVGIALSVVSYMRGEMSKKYAITTAIAVTSQNENGMFTAQSNNPNSTDIHLAEDMVDSVIFVLRSDKTLNQAVDKLNLLGVSTKDIYNNLTLAQYKNTQVIEMTLYWRSAQEGVEILSAINEVAPEILIETLKIGGVSVINNPTSKYLIGGSLNIKLWVYMTVLGAMLGAGIAVLELLFSPTLINSKDMERLFSVEVLEEIPEKRNYFKQKRNLLVAYEEDENAYDLMDAYSSLAHIIRKRIERVPHACIYVTSTSKDEGKTSTVGHLAMHLANLGMKVLVIDFDTRNPNLGGLFLDKVEYVNSLNAYYRGESVKEEAINRINGNIDVLPAILERKQILFDEELFNMIREIKQDYDVILMDTAPVGQVAYTMSLNHLADFALLVVRYDNVGIKQIEEALARLDKSGMRLLGCVVNGVKRVGAVRHSNKYGYEYGYGVYGAENGKNHMSGERGSKKE